MMQEKWRRYIASSLHPIRLGTLALCILLGLSAGLLGWRRISYLHPGPAWAVGGLTLITLIIGLTIEQVINNLQSQINNLAQEAEFLRGENDNLQRELQASQNRPEIQDHLPHVIGLEVLVNRWQEFKEKLDQSDSEMMYEQLLIVQQIFVGEPQITFKKPFAGGKPARGVFLVQPLNGSEQVLKFDRLENIRKERDRFARCVRSKLSRYTPGQPIAYWPPESTWEGKDGNTHGALVYELAQLGPRSPQTFGQYYVKHDASSVIEALQEIVRVMAPGWSSHFRSQNDNHSWWDRPINQDERRGCPRKSDNLGEQSLYHEYARLTKLEEMRNGLQTALETGEFAFQTTNDGRYFSLLDINFRNKRPLYHPLQWVEDVFDSPNTFNDRYGYLNVPGIQRDSIVHGDFHTGNILIEDHRGQLRIWLIDFPHTHVGPTVQDIARLEADIKFGLLSEKFLADRRVFEAVLTFEAHLLGNGTHRQNLDLTEKPFPPIDNVSNLTTTELNKAWQALTVLRRLVRGRCLITDDPNPYYLALLHATLPTLYYHDRGPWQKFYAFISAALLCECLSSREQEEKATKPLGSPNR